MIFRCGSARHEARSSTVNGRATDPRMRKESTAAASTAITASAWIDVTMSETDPFKASTIPT
jgi:hypothetical protein